MIVINYDISGVGDISEHEYIINDSDKETTGGESDVE